MPEKCRSMLDNKSDVIRGLIGGPLEFRGFPSAIIVTVCINTVNHVTARQATESEFSTIKRIFRNRIKELRHEFLQVLGQSVPILAETLHSQGSGGQLCLRSKTCLPNDDFGKRGQEHD